jgi:excisionase family DNA binding protein
VTGRLVAARELADYLGVSSETVLRWTRRGELPAVRLSYTRKLWTRVRRKAAYLPG